MVKLSQRLQKLADFVPLGARLADIGGDHAKLPVYLLKEEKIDFALVGEIAKGPFSSAQKAVANLPIPIRLADGLEAIEAEDAVDTLVIAGMGGILIADILGAGLEKLEQINRLILQANNEESYLRRWLLANGFALIDETLVKDQGKIYEIMVLEKGDQVLSEQELTYGKFLSGPIFVEKWGFRLKEIEKILSYLPPTRSQERMRLLAEYKEIKEVCLENSRIHGNL